MTETGSVLKTICLDFRTINLLKVYPPLLVPLFAKSIERSEKMALAMQARGLK